MDWESFMDNLTAGQMVPVIGNDLILVKNDKDTAEPLHRYLVKKWTKRLGLPYKDQTLGELALANPPKNIGKTTDAIFHRIDEDRFNCESLVKLAEITDFRFFISTTLDGLLVKALCKARKLKKNQVKET